MLGEFHIFFYMYGNFYFKYTGFDIMSFHFQPVPEESTVKETKKPKKKKRHRDKTGYDYESGSESESDSESEPVPPGLEESGEIVEGEKSEDGDEQNVSSSTETSKAKEEETPKGEK